MPLTFQMAESDNTRIILLDVVGLIDAYDSKTSLIYLADEPEPPVNLM